MIAVGSFSAALSKAKDATRRTPSDARIASVIYDPWPPTIHDRLGTAHPPMVALAKCEAIFRLQEPKNRMRDQAAHACRALCRARVAEELRFPPPWSVDEADSKLDRRCFIVRDANGHALAYVYFSNRPFWVKRFQTHLLQCDLLSN